MKAEFKFAPNDMVKSKKTGLIATITHCALSNDGIVYLQRGVYVEQWAEEDDLELSEFPKVERPTAKPAPSAKKKTCR